MQYSELFRKSGRRNCGQVFSHTTNEAAIKTKKYASMHKHTDRCSFIPNANDNPKQQINGSIRKNAKRTKKKRIKLMEI